MVAEQRLHRDGMEAQIGLGVAAPRRDQEAGALPRDLLVSEGGMGDSIREDMPGGVEVRDETGKPEDGPVHVRVERHDAARSVHGAMRFRSRKLRSALA